MPCPAHMRVTHTVRHKYICTRSYDMNANAFRHFYDYHFTVNRKIRDTYITPRSQEQFTQDVGYSHGSVRNQIVHLIYDHPS